MLNNLKYFVKQSAIYSVGNIAGKAVGVVLLPLYTSYISLADYGILAVIEVSLAISAEFLSFGQSTSVVILGNIQENREQRKRFLFTVSTFLAIILLAVGTFVQVFAVSITSLFAVESFVTYLRLACSVVLLRVINDLFLNKLRAEEQSKVYAVISLSKLTITLASTIFFVAFKGMGVQGILYAYCFGETAALSLMLPRMVRMMEFSFDRTILREALRFGAPLVIGSISGMLLNMSDRYLLGFLKGSESVALYDLGYRVAGFLNMLVILPFNLALPPIASKMYRQPGDTRYFGKIMTYLTFILVWAGLALSLFGRELITTFALNPSYWPAANVIPLLVLSYTLAGMRYVAVLGLFLTKKTMYVASLVVGAAGLSIGTNLLLIPPMGYYGAAVSSVISFCVLLAATKVISDRYYRIPLETAKLLKLVLIGAVFYVFSLWFGEISPLLSVLLKILLLVLFPFILFLWNFYEPIEVQRLKEIFMKWNDPKSWKQLFEDSN